MLAEQYLLLTRNLLSAPESDWDALFSERDALLKKIKSVPDGFLEEVLELESLLQARIGEESRRLRHLLLSNYAKRQGIEGYRSSPIPASGSIAC